MNMTKKQTGAFLAAAVAVAFIATPLKATAQDGDNYQWVKCYGINSCRGQSTCRLTTNQCKILNQCKGQNSCKGKGFVWKTPENCAKAGGTAPETPDRMK